MKLTNIYEMITLRMKQKRLGKKVLARDKYSCVHIVGIQFK